MAVVTLPFNHTRITINTFFGDDGGSPPLPHGDDSIFGSVCWTNVSSLEPVAKCSSSTDRVDETAAVLRRQVAKRNDENVADGCDAEIIPKYTSGDEKCTQAVAKPVLEPGLRAGHRVNDSRRVGSRVNVADPVSDPVLVVFARALLLLMGREYATLESARLQ